MNGRRVGLVAAALVLVLALVAVLVRPGSAVTPEASAQASAPLPSGARAVADTASAASAPDVEPITRIDPRYEMCSNVGVGGKLSQLLVEMAGDLNGYAQRQTDDLRAVALKQLLRSGASVEQQVAGHLLKGDPAAAAKAAAEGTDGRAYGMAWLACQSNTGTKAAPDASAACGALNIERWAQLEPDKAGPWLAMLAEAQSRGDRAQAVTAMHRAGMAREMVSGWGWLTNQVMSSLPEALPEGGELALLGEISGRQALLIGFHHGQGVMRYCSADALADANTRQQCEQVAQVMMARSGNFVDLTLGSRIGERLGLPPERMPVTRARLDAAQRHVQDALGGLAERPLCDISRLMIRQIRDGARLGELQAAEAAMKSQP